MKYSHTGRFVPYGRTGSISSVNTKEVTFVTDRPEPSQEEINKANIEIQKKINAYSARNHWELRDILTTYEKPPWDSLNQLKIKLRNAVSGYRKASTQTKDIQFVSVHHMPRHSAKDIRDKVKSEYDIKITDSQIEKKTNSVTRFYTTWKTDVDG